MKYTWNHVSPTWEGMPFLGHAALMYCYGVFHVDVYVLPPFKPNEHLFENDPNRSTKEKWDIFAEAVRSVMCKFGGFGKAT